MRGNTDWFNFPEIQKVGLNIEAIESFLRPFPNPASQNGQSHESFRFINRTQTQRQNRLCNTC